MERLAPEVMTMTRLRTDWSQYKFSRQCPRRRCYSQLRGGERQHLTAVSVQRIPALLRLEVSIAQGCPQIAMIEHIADQVQRHARLCKPGTDQ